MSFDLGIRDNGRTGLITFVIVVLLFPLSLLFFLLRLLLVLALLVLLFLLNISCPFLSFPFPAFLSRSSFPPSSPAPFQLLWLLPQALMGL